MVSEIYPFEEEYQAKQFHQLMSELRCMGCHNESLMDSKLPVAQELKKRVAEQIRAGSNISEVKAYLNQRYGDEIFYDPPLQGSTLFLWVAPWVLLVLVLYQIMKKVNQRSSPKKVAKHQI